VFSVVDTNTAGVGNDGALDDISLTGAVPEPGCAMMLLSSLGIFALRRRKR
jgi:hypothetical protein